jgi:hypothetical protein
VEGDIPTQICDHIYGALPKVNFLKSDNVGMVDFFENNQLGMQFPDEEPMVRGEGEGLKGSADLR